MMQTFAKTFYHVIKLKFVKQSQFVRTKIAVGLENRDFVIYKMRQATTDARGKITHLTVLQAVFLLLGQPLWTKGDKICCKTVNL